MMIKFDSKPCIKYVKKEAEPPEEKPIESDWIFVDHETIFVKLIPEKIKFTIEWLAVGHKNFECSDAKLNRLRGRKPCCGNWK